MDKVVQVGSNVIAFPDSMSDQEISAAITRQYGPDDPSGNYDFGNFGKVTGAKMNGQPATRAQAFDQLSKDPFAQVAKQALQNKDQATQDVQNFGKSAFDYDQGTKDYMKDLAATAVMGGAARMGEGAAPAAADPRGAVDGLTPLAKKMLFGNADKDLTATLIDKGTDLIPGVHHVKTVASIIDALAGAKSTNPLEAGFNADLSAALDPAAAASMREALGSTAAREAGTQAKVPSTFGGSTLQPGARISKPAPGPKSVDQLLNEAKTGAMQRYGNWTDADTSEAEPDLTGPLQESIALQKWGALSPVLKALQKK